jgi:hypothetical protein
MADSRQLVILEPSDMEKNNNTRKPMTQQQQKRKMPIRWMNCLPGRATRGRWLKAAGLGLLLALGGALGTAVLAQNSLPLVNDVLHGYPGAMMGPTTFSLDTHLGTAGYSIDFGVNGGSGIVVSNGAFLNIAASNDVMTFAVWVKRYDINQGSAFWGASPSSSDGDRGFQAHVPWSDDNIYFDTAGCCGGTLQRINANIDTFAPYEAVGNDSWWTNWHHFVFSKDAADKQIWIDGQLFLEGFNSNSLPTDFFQLTLGNSWDTTLPIHALIDDFAVYSTALSSNSINLLSTGTSPTNLPGEKILAYWSFDNPPAIGALVGSPVGFSYTLYNTTTRLADISTIALTLNGQDVTPTSLATNDTIITVNYILPKPPFLSGSTNTASLTMKDTKGNSYSASGSFVVPQFGLVQAGWAVTGVNTNQPGFRILPWQSGTEPARVYWVEEQLADLHGTNNAALSGATDGGYIDFTGIINFSLDPASAGGADLGDFTTANGYPDSYFPGIPGANGLTGSSALEVLAFLQFSSPGLYTMGVASDDGFVVTVGPDPRDRLATVCGEYDAGRGTTESDFQVYVASAGIYPFCLRYFNGAGELPGNAGSLEWFTVQPNGTKFLINDPSSTNTSGIKAFFSGPALPAYVSQINPYEGDTVAWPDRVLVQLTDAGTQVKTTPAPALLIDGTPTSPVISKQGSVTTVLTTLPVPGLAPGQHTATLVWSDTGTLNASNSWSFTVGSFPTLYQSMSAPVNSVDKTQPGFVLKVTQLDPSTVGDSGDQIGGNVEECNGLLAGLYFPDYGTNQADTVNGGATGIPAVFANIWYWTNAVDFNIVTSPGDFTYDYNMPGIPGNSGYYGCFAAGFQTYVVFPTAGFYRMGVNSDDGFRVTEGIGVTRQVLHVTGPGIDKDVLGVLNSTNDAAGWGGILPTTPLIAPAVYLDATAACPKLPAGNLTNKIGIIEYNSCSTYNALEAAWCVQTNGGLAAIVVNQPGYGLPFTENGDTGYPATIPVLVVDGRSADGGSGELDFWRTNSLTVNIAADAHLKLVEANEAKSMSDVDSGFWVPAPGAYPLRLLYYQQLGGAGCEWSTIIPGVTVDGGTRSLVNDSTDPNSLMAYRAVTVLPKMNPPTVSDGAITVTWNGAGILQSTTTLEPSNWADVIPQPGNNVYTTSASGDTFYRVRVPNPVTP